MRVHGTIKGMNLHQLLKKAFDYGVMREATMQDNYTFEAFLEEIKEYCECKSKEGEDVCMKCGKEIEKL